MRLEIETNGPIKDNDLKAIMIADHALTKIGSKRMLKANLEYLADKHGFILGEK